MFFLVERSLDFPIIFIKHFYFYVQDLSLSIVTIALYNTVSALSSKFRH